MLRKIVGAGALLCSALSVSVVRAQAPTAAALKDGWSVQSGCKLDSPDGTTISTSSYHPEGWYKASVPATVLTVQVASGEYKDPYYGLNMRNIPGGDYPMGHTFARLPMPDGSPYRCAWWYRKEFEVPASEKGRTQWMRFEGINYRANVWVNGKRIADVTQVAGAYRTYEFNVTDAVTPGKPNVVAVETFAPKENDLGINWVDWNPCPPDKDMGLWGPVSLSSTGPVALRSPLAVTHFTDATLKQANLTVYAELHNATDKAVRGTVSGTVAGIRIEQTVELKPNEDKTVAFDPETYKQLQVKNAQVWWPYQMGTPHLENLTLRFTENGKVSDEASVRFGIREITSEMTDKGYKLFRVNGKPILIRGAGWSPDMLLRQDPKQLRNELMLVRDMHLNTIRLEGKLETEDFFRLADEQGILVMLGWCCCDQWEAWAKWTPENHAVAEASLRSQMLRIRHHASLLVWLNGSDNPPPADVESAYLKIEEETHWPNPTLSSASSRATAVTGNSGVKMSGPYDYVDPSYWYIDKYQFGGGYGFNTETSPGPAIPNVQSLQKFLPADQMWPTGNIAWKYHSGGGHFESLGVFDGSMNATYGKPNSLKDYSRISQTMTYNGERAMYEAYSRNKYTSTGVIQWMLNNAWPSVIWHLFDYYLDAGGGYYGTKIACEPLHVQYSYDDHSIVVVNSTYEASPKLSVSAKVYNLELQQVFHRDLDLTVNADTSQRAIEIPDATFDDESSVYFVDLVLKKSSGEVVSRNFYWIPAKLSQFDWKKSDWAYTPVTEHEDMTELASLPQAQVEAQTKVETSGESKKVEVELHNPSKALAFQVVVVARNGNGEDITPAAWSDNYIELMPGESRQLTVSLPAQAAGDAQLVLSGWNVPEQTLHLSAAKTVASR